jgi:hypothetical protein
LRYERGWALKMGINGVGALCTLVVLLVFALTKFEEGAWVVLVLLPALVYLFSAIHRHYRALARQLSLDYEVEPIRSARHCVILLVGGVHQGTRAARGYARMLSDDVTAVHVALNPAYSGHRQQDHLW